MLETKLIHKEYSTLRAIVYVFHKHTWNILQERFLRIENKRNLSKFKDIEVILIIYADQKIMKPEINNRKKIEKSTNI